MLEVDAGDELELGGLVVACHACRARVEPRALLGANGCARLRRARVRSSVYFAGDTDLFDGMAELGPLDVAVLPVSGWGSKVPAGHLDPRRAAEALRLLRPRIAVPVHWGTFRTPFAPRPDDRPAVEFARAAAELAPEVDVRVLAIGETARARGGALKPWVKRGLAIALAVAVIVGTYVFVLPQFADYSEVWAQVRTLSWEWIVVLLATVVLNLATFAPPWMVALPGLGYWPAQTVTQASTASTYLAPGGPAVGIGSRRRCCSAGASTPTRSHSR